MKRTAMQHTKLKRLVRALKVPQYAAVGILESLWHLTAREAPEGNIGKLSNEDIAIWIDWEGESDALIYALVAAGWIDEDEYHRLMIHDWQEHADDATKKAMSRQKEKVPDNGGNVQTRPDKTRLPVPVPVPSQSQEITPEMITRSVLTETGLAGRDLSVVLDEVCRSQMKLYGTPGALRDAMVTAWRDYDAAKPKLGYTKGAAKFFGDGDWRNKEGWPWKPGEAPIIRKVQVENKALQAIREREEAVRRERGK